MKIGERNLIIGKIFSVISESSISLFFYIKKQVNYILEKIDNMYYILIPTGTSPPK